MVEPVAACSGPRSAPERVPVEDAFMLLFHSLVHACTTGFWAVVSEIPDSLNRYLKAHRSAEQDTRSNQDTRLPEHLG